MIKLAPSILSADFAVLGNQIRVIENAGAHYVHIDVMDGHFVPNISFGIPIIKSIRKVTDMTFDVHLMIDKPERYIEAIIDAGADIVNFHYEATEQHEKIIEIVKSHDKRVGMTINPDTSEEVLYKYLKDLDLALIMSVYPGFGGQKLIEDTLQKASRLSKVIKENNYLTEIEMDGGISLSNVDEVIKSCVNVVVAGSSVFNAPNIKDTIKEFYTIFNEEL